MKAIICPRYCSPDVLQLQEVDKPTPQQDEVLFKIHAAFLNSRDLRLLRVNPNASKLQSGLQSPWHHPGTGRSMDSPGSQLMGAAAQLRDIANGQARRGTRLTGRNSWYRGYSHNNPFLGGSHVYDFRSGDDDLLGLGRDRYAASEPCFGGVKSRHTFSLVLGG